MFFSENQIKSNAQVFSLNRLGIFAGKLHLQLADGLTLNSSNVPALKLLLSRVHIYQADPGFSVLTKRGVVKSGYICGNVDMTWMCFFWKIVYSSLINFV